MIGEVSSILAYRHCRSTTMMMIGSGGRGASSHDAAADDAEVGYKCDRHGSGKYCENVLVRIPDHAVGMAIDVDSLSNAM